jgi:TonB family protein
VRLQSSRSPTERFFGHMPVLCAISVSIGACAHAASPPAVRGSEQAQNVSTQDCVKRPEVMAYLKEVRSRIFTRWVLPADMPPNQVVSLLFVLNADGSIARVRTLGSDNPELAASAVKAFQAAAPFPAMSENVRCAAGKSLTADFRNPTAPR